MAIEVTCPFCRKQWSAPAGAAGRMRRCPRCGAPGPVPEGAAGAGRRPDYLGGTAVGAGALALVVACVPLVSLLAYPLAVAAAALAVVGLALASHRGAARALPVVALALALVAAVTAPLVDRLVAGIERRSRPPAPVAAGPHSLPQAPPTLAGGNPPPPADPADPFSKLDANRDGRLNADEVPVDRRGRFAALDRDADGYVARAEWDRAGAGAGPAAPAPAPGRGKTLATAVFTAADDFVVDAWQDGRRVDPALRHMVSESYGATSERLDIEVREGDWLVFLVANNRLRWNGSAYFGAAGVDASGGVAFATLADDPHWSYCDDPADAPAFIARPDYLADRSPPPPTRAWKDGDAKMRANVPDWAGGPVWGRERATWIKYVAPAPGTSATPPAPKLPLRLARVGTLAGHPGPVRCLALTPDGKTAIAGGAPGAELGAAGGAETVVVWDLAPKPRRRLALPVGLAIPTLAATPDGRGVVVPAGGRYEVVNLLDGRTMASLIGSQGVAARAVAVAPDGKAVAGSIDQGDVVLWDPATRQAIRTLHVGDRDVQLLAFAPDGKLLAAATGDGVVRLWDVATGELRVTCGAPVAEGAPATALAFTPDGKSVAAVVGGKPPTLWEVATGTRQRALGAEVPFAYHGLAFAPDGRLAAATGVDPRGAKPADVVALLDMTTGRLAGLVADPDGPTRGVAFAPDGKSLLATGGATVKVWEVGAGP